MSTAATPRPVHTLLWRVLVAPETFLLGRDGQPRVFTSERAARKAAGPDRHKAGLPAGMAVPILD